MEYLGEHPTHKMELEVKLEVLVEDTNVIEIEKVHLPLIPATA